MDRRDLIKRFGYAGFVASSLIGRRPTRAQPAAAPPRRLILFYTPGGFYAEAYSPDEARTGANAGVALDMPLSQVTLGTVRGGKRQSALEPLDDPRLAPLKNDLLVLDGIDMRSVAKTGADSCDEHCSGISAALRGRPRKLADPAEAGIMPGWSIDRIIGANLFPSGSRPVQIKSTNVNVLLGEYGYQGSIREASEGGTSLEVKSVEALWDGLFKDFMPPAPGGGTPVAGPSPGLLDAWERRKQLTALHQAELQALKARLGKDEQVTLDRHLAAMNEVTLELESTVRAAKSGGATTSTARGSVPARPDASALDPKRQLPALCGLAANIIVQAMAFDRCRVAVIHLFGQNNNVSYWYPGATGPYHDGVCHGGRKGGGVMADAALSANKTVVGMYLDVALKVKSVAEGAGSMLDSTTVATFSDMSNGNHEYKIPTLFMMAGGGGLGATGRRVLKTGRYLKYVDRGHTDYLLSLAHTMGVTEITDPTGARRPLDQIGNPRYGKGPLDRLT
jgi:hypothetical protein